MKAIILAGGQGDRLDKYSPEYTGIPKPMLPLNIFFKHNLKLEILNKLQKEIKEEKNEVKLKLLQKQYRILVFGKDYLGKYVK